MASAKRQRQRANKQLSPNKSIETKPRKTVEVNRRVDKLFEADKVAYKNTNTVQKVAGLAIAAMFYYGVFAKQFAIVDSLRNVPDSQPPIPTFRNVLPEPFDFFNHIGNVYWTKILMDVHLPLIRRPMKDVRFGLNHIRHRLFGDERPNIAKRTLTAGAVGVALHTVVEGVSEVMPGVIGELLGGFDPIDVAYGASAAAVISGYDMLRRRNAIDDADQQIPNLETNIAK